MKKLMIAAAIVCAAVASQAAAMKWTLTAKLPGSTVDPVVLTQTGTSIKASTANLMTYVWAADSAVSGNIFDAAASYDKSTSTYSIGNLGTQITSSSWKSTTATYTDATTYGAGDDAYGVVLYVYDANKDGKINAGDYYLANQATWHFDADSNKSLALMTTSSASWVAVPEPTSGLLLLLGMAGLALRRRRA